jgi:hypothetical protein
MFGGKKNKLLVKIIFTDNGDLHRRLREKKRKRRSKFWKTRSHTSKGVEEHCRCRSGEERRP